MLVPHGPQNRLLPVAASRHELRAARVEGAAGRPVEGVRHGARGPAVEFGLRVDVSELKRLFAEMQAEIQELRSRPSEPAS